MLGFSTADGFVEISECLAEMIKYLANEPSVGLYYVQQHTQKAVPNVIKHKKIVTDKAHETSLHTEDLEDSIVMVRSMKECGFPIVDEMTRDIKNSLATMATKKPKRGLIHHQFSSNSLAGKRASWSSPALDFLEGHEKSGYSFSSVFTKAKQMSRNLIPPQLEDRRSMSSRLSASSASISSALQGLETDEVASSSKVEDELQHEETDISEKLLLMSEKYNDYKATKEAQLEKWLEGASNRDDNG